KVTPVKGADQVPMDAWRNVEARLLAGTAIDSEALLRLAGTRAEGIRAALVGTLGVGDDRVFLRPPSWRAAAEGRAPSVLELGGRRAGAGCRPGSGGGGIGRPPPPPVCAPWARRAPRRAAAG